VVTSEAGADLVVTGAKAVATCDAEHRELAGGWVAVTGGLISAVGGAADPRPAARETLDASGCLVTPTPTITCTRTSPGRMPPSPAARCSSG